MQTFFWVTVLIAREYRRQFLEVWNGRGRSKRQGRIFLHCVGKHVVPHRRDNKCRYFSDHRAVVVVACPRANRDARCVTHNPYITEIVCGTCFGSDLGIREVERRRSSEFRSSRDVVRKDIRDLSRDLRVQHALAMTRVAFKDFARVVFDTQYPSRWGRDAVIRETAVRVCEFEESYFTSA